MTGEFLIAAASSLILILGALIAAAFITHVWEWGRAAAQRRRDLREWWSRRP